VSSRTDLDKEIYIHIDITENIKIHLDRDKHYRKQRCTVCPFAQYGVATCSRIDEILGLFCRIVSL